MMYLSGIEVYLQYIKNKEIDVPPLPAADELEIQTAITTLTQLAFDLNATPKFFRWFMIGKKSAYKKANDNLVGLLKFWTFKRGIHKQLMISKPGKA
jgi:hypothetical protein